MLHARLRMAWSRVALPLLAAYPLLTAGSLCGRLLEAPGTAPLLRSLHQALTLAQ